MSHKCTLSHLGPAAAAYTVALEVAYKSKIAAGSTVLCTTEVESMEGRKLWMKATVSGRRSAQSCFQSYSALLLRMIPK